MNLIKLLQLPQIDIDLGAIVTQAIQKDKYFSIQFSRSVDFYSVKVMISGIFENCIGTTDLEATLKYWAELGYREIDRGQFTAAQAKQLYGHDSALTCVRLQNGQTTTHGLNRVFAWDQLRDRGLQQTLPLVQGSRWFASLTSDIYTVWDAFSDNRDNGNDWIVTEPVRAIEGIGNKGTGGASQFCKS